MGGTIEKTYRNYEIETRAGSVAQPNEGELA